MKYVVSDGEEVCLEVHSAFKNESKANHACFKSIHTLLMAIKSRSIYILA